MKRAAAIVAALALIVAAPLFRRIGAVYRTFDPLPLDSAGAYSLIPAHKLRDSNPNDPSFIVSELWLVTKDTARVFGRNLDQLSIPRMATNERVFYGRACRLHGRVDPSVVAIGTIDDQPSPMIRLAWKADTSRKAFKRLGVSGVTCKNPA